MGGLLAAGALAAAGAGVWYYHKDMSQEELRGASESYVSKTKEVSTKAYEGAKPYVQAAAAKTAEASKFAYGKLMSYFYPEGEQEAENNEELPEEASEQAQNEPTIVADEAEASEAEEAVDERSEL